MGLCSVMWYTVPTIIVIYAIRKYRESKWGKCTNQVSLDGKIVLITGANSGLGYEAAQELYLRGATVIMACRDKAKAHKAMDDIKQVTKTSKNGNLDYFELDLASLHSISKCCSDISHKYQHIDILINNAGLSQPLKAKLTTEDGFELHLGVNYIGHFMLTNLLFPLLCQSSEARVVNVSSLLHQKASLHLDDLNFDKRPLVLPYAESKLLMIYFGQEFARLMAAKGENISVYNVCPGWVYTNLFRHSFKNWFKVVFAIPVALFFMRTPKQGVQTIVYCATEPTIPAKSGSLFRDCVKYNSAHKFNAADGLALWQKTKKMIEEKGHLLPI